MALNKKVLGSWEGTGSEVYCEVDKQKTYKVTFNIEMNIKKVNDNVYRVKSKYFYSKSGKIFGFSYEKNDSAGSDNFLFSVNDNGLVGSGIWNEKDKSSRTIEFINFDEDFSNLHYKYNTNEIANPLNSYLKRVSSSVGRLLGTQNKISVAGHYMLEKLD
jgi:hypothetical protein